MAYETNNTVRVEEDNLVPVQQASELLAAAQSEMQGVDKQGELWLSEMLAGITKSIDLINGMSEFGPQDPENRSAANTAMDNLREVLGSMQGVAENEPGLENATRQIAKTLAILYPLSQYDLSKAPAPPALPNSVPPQIMERRRAPRANIEAEIGFQSDTNFFMGFSEDISTGGLFIATYDVRPMGSTLNVNFTLPGGHLISADGVVRWVREYNETTPDTTPGMGIQFENLSPEDKDAIEVFIDERPAMFYDDE